MGYKLKNNFFRLQTIRNRKDRFRHLPFLASAIIRHNDKHAKQCDDVNGYFVQ